MNTGQFPARKLFTAIGLIVGAMILAAVVYSLVLSNNAPQMSPANAVNIIKAARAYTHDLQSKRQPIPQSTSLTNLVALKFLSPDDAAPFDGLETTLYLLATNPAAKPVLLRIKMPDGSQTVLLEDGSSHVIPAGATQTQ